MANARAARFAASEISLAAKFRLGLYRGMTLREYRRSYRLTLAAMAERIGCALTTVHGLEAGRRAPSLAMLERIEQATNGEVRAQDFVRQRAEAA